MTEPLKRHAVAMLLAGGTLVYGYSFANVVVWFVIAVFLSLERPRGLVIYRVISVGEISSSRARSARSSAAS